MTRPVNNVASGNVLIDALIKTRRFDPATAVGGSVTYRFAPSANHYQNIFNYVDGLAMPLDMTGYTTATDALVGTFQAATTSLQSTIVAAFGQFSSLTNLSFAAAAAGAAANYYTSAADNRQDGVDISIGMANMTTGGFGIQPSDGRRGGDLWFDTASNRFGNSGDADGITKGENDYRVVLHEIGHALGLRHPHEPSAGAPAPSAVLPTAWDSMEFTLMTYRMYVGGPAVLSSPNDVEAHSFAQSLMMLDIQALQYMYGADFTTNAGSTTYTFNPATGEMSIDGAGQGRPGGAGASADANRIFLTIWDGGGNDTYDFSNYTTNLKVNLAPGGFTNLGTQLAQLSVSQNKFARGNIFNALLYRGDQSSLIENARGGSGNDTIVGNQAANSLTGYDGNDSLSGGSGADGLRGNAGKDTLDGGSGNDFLAGGAGADSMLGGKNDDSYQVDDAGDKVVELLGEGTDSVIVLGGLGSYALTANTENLSFLGYDENGARVAANRSGTGNALANSMTSYYDAATLAGGGGNDTIQGSGLTDKLDGGDGNDRLIGGRGADTVSGGAGNDTVIIVGLDETDNVDGGSGIDTLDLSGVTNAGFTPTVVLDAHVWYINFNQISSITGVENLIGSTFGDDLEGDALANVIDGRGGNDYMAGRAGNDTYYVDTTGDTVSELVNGGIDTVVAVTPGAYTLADNVENLRYGGGLGAGASLTGNALANVIDGGFRSDTLDGGDDASPAIVDTLRGGDGGDTYLVRDANDRVIEAANAGFDTVQTALASYTLPTQVEVLRFVGAGTRVGVGNGTANNLYGGAGNDRLRGLGDNDWLDGGGADGQTDTLEGGTGDDTYRIWQGGGADKVIERAGEGIDWIYSTDAASIDLGNYANVENVTVSTTGGTLTVLGNALSNRLTSDGSTCNDSLVGGAGNDTLWGGFGGVDVLKGGTGNDMYNVSKTTTFTIDESDGNGIDTVGLIFANVNLGDASFIGAIENLIFGGGTGDSYSGTGNSLANLIRSLESDDSLDGGGKGFSTNDGVADTLIGGWGDDTYYIHDARDVLIERAAAGFDTVIVDAESPMSYTLLANFEALAFTDGPTPLNYNGTGNAVANSIAGSTGNNVLKGLAGNDTINGRAGNDTIYGGGGLDVLYGENGADVFVFNGALAGSADTISDFLAGTDKLWLDDAVMLGIRNVAGTLDAAQFVNMKLGQSLTAATRIYEDAGGALYYDRDGSGAAAGVKIADLGAASLSATDIKVI